MNWHSICNAIQSKLLHTAFKYNTIIVVLSTYIYSMTNQNIYVLGVFERIKYTGFLNFNPLLPPRLELGYPGPLYLNNFPIEKERKELLSYGVS